MTRLVTVLDGSTGRELPTVLRVLVADSEPLLAEGVRGQLAGSHTVRYQGKATEARAVHPACVRLAPDLVLLDGALDRSGTLAPKLKALPHAPLLAMMVPDGVAGTRAVRPALAAGAELVLPRSVSGAELLAAIEQVRTTTPVVHPRFETGRPRPGWGGDSTITGRQLEVLCLLAEGERNEAIAETLSVTPETVRTHVKGLRHALKATSKAHAVSRAFELGLLAPAPLDAHATSSMAR